jgi:hypothetical protein
MDIEHQHGGNLIIAGREHFLDGHGRRRLDLGPHHPPSLY